MSEKVVGLVFEYDCEDYCLWTDFDLTEEEQKIIAEIVSHHIDEGCSVRGSWKDIKEEM